MNFVGLSIPFQAEVTEEDPGAASNIAPEERPSHPHSEQMRVVHYSKTSDVITGKQAGDLEDMGILVGEVYDERIIEDSLHQGKNPINESLVNSNQNKKGC